MDSRLTSFSSEPKNEYRHAAEESSISLYPDREKANPVKEKVNPDRDEANPVRDEVNGGEVQAPLGSLLTSMMFPGSFSFLHRHRRLDHVRNGGQTTQFFQWSCTMFDNVCCFQFSLQCLANGYYTLGTLGGLRGSTFESRVEK